MPISIERKAMSALQWAAAAKLVVQVLSWAGTLVVVRLLTPEDYGLMAKVAVVSTIAGAIAELGLGSSIVRSGDIAREDLKKICGVSLLFGSAVTLILMVAAPLLAVVFRDPRLTWPIACASTQIFVGALAIIPSAMLERELNFRPIAKIEMTVGFITISVTLLLAWFGAGVWALVLGTLSGAIVRSAILLMIGTRISPVFSFRGIDEHLKFGLTLVSSRISYTIMVQSDVLIGSVFLSTTDIGRYSVALQLASLPMAKAMGIINQIMLPAIARQQGDMPRVRQSLLKSVGLLATVAFPALWGISAVAPDLVRVLFGQKWSAVAPALAILPLIVPLRMICTVIFTTSFALGNRRLDLRNTILSLILMPSGFFVGAHWGTLGLCCSWLVSVPLVYSYTVPAALRLLGIPARHLLLELGAPAISAGIMYLAVATLRPLFASRPEFATLLALVTSGALVYVVCMATIARKHLSRAIQFARALLATRDRSKIV